MKKVSIKEQIYTVINELLSLKKETGEFEDFKLVMGYSTEWITGYVLQIFFRYFKDYSDQLTKSVDFLINSRRSTGGWGYNSLVIADADSTANVIGCLANDDYVSDLDLHFLIRHITDYGGVRTYDEEDIIMAIEQNNPFFYARDLKSYRGWMNPTVSVSANTLYALENIKEKPIIREKIAKFIIDQNDDGFWYDYWWDEWHYPTLCAIRALGDKLPTNLTTKLVNCIMEQRIDDVNWGGLFRTVCAVACLELLGKNPFDKSYIIEYILTSLHSKEKGSACMRVPPACDINPYRAVRIQDEGVFSLATSLLTLGVLFNENSIK